MVPPISHQQASAAFPVAMRSPKSITRYADVSLIASMLQDEVLVRSLDDLFLAPLTEERDGGAVLRETLRAYFTAERNVSSAAAMLDVTRHTVTNRLHAAEERLGRPLATCATEVEVALRLHATDEIAAPGCNLSPEQ